MHLELIRDSSRVFRVPPNAAAVESARIWHCKYKSLESLSQLSNLKTLLIATYPDDTLRILSRLTCLKYLSIVHFPRVAELDALDSLHALETLSLQTLPSWDASGKVQIVRSIEPIAALPALRHLELFGVRSADGSLEPLLHANLTSARFSKHEKAEVERFFRSSGAVNKWNPEPVFDADVMPESVTG